VRNKIKMFAQKKVTLPPGRHKIIILDEADRYSISCTEDVVVQWFHQYPAVWVPTTFPHCTTHVSPVWLMLCAYCLAPLLSGVASEIHAHFQLYKKIPPGFPLHSVHQNVTQLSQLCCL
jgi:hypothetical protein